jgi:hypothetical protein
VPAQQPAKPSARPGPICAHPSSRTPDGTTARSNQHIPGTRHAKTSGNFSGHRSWPGADIGRMLKQAGDGSECGIWFWNSHVLENLYFGTKAYTDGTSVRLGSGSGTLYDWSLVE